jgi:phosphatidylglycerol:prolipoprotein diacylglycerol transferase
MLPVLFTLGTLPVRANFVFSTLGFLVCLWVGSHLAQRTGYSRRQVLWFFAGLIVSAFLVGMLNAWLFNLPSILRYPHWRKLIFSGWVSHGGILGALLFCQLAPHLSRQDVQQRTDLIALMLPLYEGIYRIGCLLNGCCYGKPYTGLGAMLLPGELGNWELRFPTQALYSLLGFGLFLLLLWLRGKIVRQGRLAVVYLVLYGIGRFAIDTMRGDAISLGMINLHQAADILLILMGLSV